MISKNDLHDISVCFKTQNEEELVFLELKYKICKIFEADDSLQIFKANAMDIKNILFKDSANVDNKIILKFIAMHYIPRGRRQNYAPFPGMAVKSGEPYLWIRDMAESWKSKKVKK